MMGLAGAGPAKAGPRQRGPANSKGHVIVCGLQGVGLRTVEQLHLSNVGGRRGRRRPRPAAGPGGPGWGVPHIHQSAHLGEGLTEAELDTARAVVCAAADEVLTLEIALRVRELRPDVRLVVQMANPSVGQALERVTGPGSVLDVAALSAPSFVEACLRRPTHHMTLGGVGFSVQQLTVADAGELPSTLRHRFGQLAPVAVMPVDGSEMVVCPGRDHPVVAGDRVAVLGTTEELERLDVDRARRPGPPRRRSARWPASGDAPRRSCRRAAAGPWPSCWPACWAS